MAEVYAVITEQTGNGVVYVRRLTEREFDGGLAGLEESNAPPGTAAAVGKWSWMDAADFAKKGGE